MELFLNMLLKIILIGGLLGNLHKWLLSKKVIGITNINTRTLTIKIKRKGALKAGIFSKPYLKKYLFLI